MMNRFRSLLALIFLFTITYGLFSQTAAHTLIIETSKGNIKCILYEETPLHTDNFVSLVNKGFYEGLLFHRVIQDFMIQTGDPGSRNAPEGKALGYGDAGYTIPGEFHPALYHKKGVLAAARQGDQVNPARESNSSQFYIVQGKKMTDEELDAMEASGAHIKFTPEQRKIYMEQGGTPHLDYTYSVFGEVIDGFDVIAGIVSVPTDERDRPLNDVSIIKITVLE
jgi:peptidyl-prolyl cis-trans isomerase B (cyclophilin B)